jgi:hypothetical protein
MSGGTAIYKILGLEPTASEEDIKSAYRKAARERHPDLNKDDPEAEDKFKRVKKAYDLLSDTKQRKEWHRKYDLPWLWEEPKKNPDEPPEGLNWCCVACSGKVEYRCVVCKIGLCAHEAFMVRPEGAPMPAPVCRSCKEGYDDRTYRDWKLKNLIKQKFGVNPRGL